MRLLPRLLLMGAVLPTVAAAIVLAIVVRLFGQALEDELDRALLAQAAVESVSLFDGPRGLHLHMSSSPLLDEVKQFAPEAAVYDVAGDRILSFPAEGVSLPMRWPQPVGEAPSAASRQARLTTSAEGRSRRLAVVVPAPRGHERYLLVLSASRTQLLQPQATLTRLATGSVVALLILLSVLTFLQARRLSARVQRLITHQARVSQGHLDAPPPDDGGDEIAALRDAAAVATAELAASRLARERFLAEAAHELRTPLASMRVALDLALRRAKKTPTSAASAATIADLVAALEETRDETGRLTALAQGLLDVAAARSAPFSTTPADVVAIARSAVAARHDEAASRHIAITVDGTDDLVAPVHAVSLRRALDNLVDNALKHAAHTVTVTVTITPTSSSVAIGVVDDGPGIPAGAVEAVFAPFHRLDPEGDGGVGLGLALVREVARRHGGDATATPGPGGRVVVTLPR